MSDSFNIRADVKMSDDVVERGRAAWDRIKDFRKREFGEWLLILR